MGREEIIRKAELMIELSGLEVLDDDSWDRGQDSLRIAMDYFTKARSLRGFDQVLDAMHHLGVYLEDELIEDFIRNKLKLFQHILVEGRVSEKTLLYWENRKQGLEYYWKEIESTEYPSLEKRLKESLLTKSANQSDETRS